jgi:maleylacetate reductase
LPSNTVDKARCRGAAASGPVDFTHDSLPGRVVFGAGVSQQQLLHELDRLGSHSVLVIASSARPEMAQRLVAVLAERSAGVVALPAATSRSASAQFVAETAARLGSDALLVAGGGAAISVAKGAAVRRGVPLVALPTTYAGVELSPLFPPLTGTPGEPGSSAHALPEVVIYDPKLTFSLPAELTASSALSALANGVEALCCTNASPVSSLIAEEGIRQIAEGARDAVLHPDGLLGRSITQFGAYLTGAAAAVSDPGLLQTVGEALTQVSGVGYADARAVLVPHYVAAQLKTRPLVVAAIAAALGCDDAVEGLHELATDLGSPRSLVELGVTEDQLAQVIEVCVAWACGRTRRRAEKILPGLLGAALHEPN